MNKCIGCGIKLQDSNKDIPGYVKDLSFDYCERCFRNINYSELKDEILNYSNEDIIKEINKSSSLTFFVVDFFNITNDIVDLYQQIITPKYLVVNKLDTIPKNINTLKITKFLKEIYNINEKVIFTSNKNTNLALCFKDYQNIYFCGLSNSGKTSLISKITSNKSITTSTMINTTQDYLKIDYEDKQIVDCPGFILPTNEVSNKYLKVINPSNLIKVRNYQLKEHTVLNIHDLIKIEFLDPNITSCYVSNGLIIKKEYHDIDNYSIIDIPSNSDLVIKGIGFLNIKKAGRMMIPNNLVYEIRNSIF